LPDGGFLRKPPALDNLLQLHSQVNDVSQGPRKCRSPRDAGYIPRCFGEASLAIVMNSSNEVISVLCHHSGGSAVGGAVSPTANSKTE
jgi:hypothetical protein